MRRRSSGMRSSRSIRGQCPRQLFGLQDKDTGTGRSELPNGLGGPRGRTIYPVPAQLNRRCRLFGRLSRHHGWCNSTYKGPWLRPACFRRLWWRRSPLCHPTLVGCGGGHYLSETPMGGAARPLTQSKSWCTGWRQNRSRLTYQVNAKVQNCSSVNHPGGVPGRKRGTFPIWLLCGSQFRFLQWSRDHCY